ncbi:hypothetical protein Hanom_Chr05g00465591 [Helianthus anomalus]
MYLRKLVNYAEIPCQDNKCWNSMPYFGGFANYIPPPCGDIVNKTLNFKYLHYVE